MGKWRRRIPSLVGISEKCLYFRNNHYVLQWWDPAAKANRPDRVNGDLVEAIARARQIEEKLLHFQTAGQPRHQRLSHVELVRRFLEDLQRRADAGQISPATVRRYRAALGHFLAFCQKAEGSLPYSSAAGVNREFQMAFTTFLIDRSVTGNGRRSGTAQPMKGRSFVLGTVRALFEWAADPDRGNLLPEGFRNPFRRRVDSESGSGEDPLKEPDISLEMALDFVRVCDAYQLRLFIPLLFFGLRASEPCFLFREYLEDLWLRVPCNPDLVYLTKGRRDIRFPLIESLQSFWNFLRAGPGQGLLYNRRSVYEGKELAPLQGRSLAELVLVFQQQVREAKSLDAAGRLRLRSQVLHEAGGMNYDDVQGEFEGLARRLGWSKEATLKDFRHLFCTTLENAAMPEAYRRYLMGHAPGKAAIMAYTHLNQLRQRYAEAIQREWQPLVEAINQRLRQIQVS